MKSKLTNLVKKVIISSLAGIVSQNSEVTDLILPISNGLDKSQIESQISGPKLTPKLILKKTINNLWEILAHTSHSSHSSHRSHSSHSSHYSSSTGSYTPSSNTPKSTSTTSNTAKTYTSPNTTSLSPSNPPTVESNNGLTLNNPQLGSRTLKKGMTGYDVTELINILIKKQYLKLENDQLEMTGVHLFDEIVENAIKRFQEDNGLTVDGICGQTTIYYLKNKS